MKKLWMLVAISISFLGLRLWNLPERLNFSMDQGMFASRSLEIWQNKEIRLLGPPASPMVEGRQFFQGPLTYYYIIGLGIIGRWNPLVMSWVQVWLILITNLYLWKVIQSKINEKTAWIYLIFVAFCPIFIKYSNFIWNPNILLLTTPLLMAAFLKKRWLIFGIIAGLSLQLHFQSVPIVLAILGWLFYYEKRKIINFGVGVVIGYLPLILFDLRNEFYNIMTIWLWLTGDSKGKVVLQEYYVLAVALIFVLGLSIWIGRIKWWQRAIVIGVIIIWGLFCILFQQETIGMPKNWSYTDLITTKQIVLKNVDGKFNVVNLLSGDSRFYPLRYLLIINNKKVEKVDDYKLIDQLFVVDKKGAEEKINSSNLWEIYSFGGKVTASWSIDSFYNLYLLRK